MTKVKLEKRRQSRGQPPAAPPPEEFVARPTISPIDGSYPDEVADVTITCADAGATIYYEHAVDSLAPTPTEASTEYTVPFTITDLGVNDVKAKAFEAGKSPSLVAGRSYTIFDSTPSGDSWDVRKMRPRPGDEVFSVWTGPIGPYRIVGDGDGTGAPTHATISAACAAAAPGDYILLRDGYHWVTSIVVPDGVFIASYPDEIGWIMFCIQAAYDDPLNFWEGVPGTTVDEYRSVGTYTGTGSVVAWFSDTMIPIQNTKQVALEATSELAPYGPKQPDGWTGLEDPVIWTPYYGGPCNRYDTATGQLRIRLSHTNLKFLEQEDRWDLGGDYNYKGEIDPRQLSLFVGHKIPNGNIRMGHNSGLRDLVIVGGGGDFNIETQGRSNVTLENVHSYPGVSGPLFQGGSAVTVSGGVWHGVAAPWSSRAWQKYNGTPHYNMIFNKCPNSKLTRARVVDGHDLVRFAGATPANPGVAGDYEVSWCLFEHGNDDMLYMPGHDSGVKHIFGNIFRGCVTSIPTTGSSKLTEAPGDGVYCHHNYFDRRRGCFGGPPRTSLDDLSLYYAGRDVPDFDGSLNITHGGDYPERIRLHFYHNLIVSASHGGVRYHRGLGNSLGNSETFDHNNIYVQIENPINESLDVPPKINPVTGLPYPYVYERSHNLAYTMGNPTFVGAIPTEIYADPKLVHLSTDRFDSAEDLRLTNVSPCRGAGMDIPATWPMVDFGPGVDPTDVGAIPYGVAGPLTRILGPDSEYGV